VRGERKRCRRERRERRKWSEGGEEHLSFQEIDPEGSHFFLEPCPLDFAGSLRKFL
jgi:hypothetical protein